MSPLKNWGTSRLSPGFPHDNQNRVTRRIDSGNTIYYTYDAAGRMTQAQDNTGTYGFTYDNMNRLAQTSTHFTSGPTRTFTVQYAYDAASNRVTLTDPENGTTHYSYDTLNRLTSLNDFQSHNFTFSYDALSRRTQLTRPNGINTSYSYDNVSHLLSVLHQLGSSTVDGASYTYDSAGNRTAKTDQASNVTSSYGYDAIYQLTGVSQGSTTTESYTYDSVGNRLSSLGVSPYSYNSSNQLTSTPSATYTYDSNGSTKTKVDSSGTTTYNWDYVNQLSSVVLPGSGGTVSFKYGPFGRRIQKSSPSGTVNYLYDGANLIEEVDTSGNVLARYTYTLGVDEPLTELRSGTTSYYQADGLGSISSLSTSAGALANTYGYDSYGKLTASTGTLTNPFQYTAREFDSETGLYYNRARYFDQNTGRFSGEDPERFDAGINFYAYVHNNPTNMIDPFGLAQCVYSISLHTIVCQPNADGFQPAIIGPNGPGAVQVGPDDVFSGLGHCRNNPSCEYSRNEGPIPPGRYKMNYYWEKQGEGHDRYRLEPWPNDSLSRLQRDLSHWRYYGLGAQLHRGHYSMGCINAVQDDPATMQQYDQMFKLLMGEDGANFMTVIQ